LVVIHPFTDGNGRTSRFVMDFILQSYGLPTPVLDTMDDDVYVNEDEWAAEVKQGLENTIVRIKECIDQADKPQCQNIPQ
jgi:Fic family protein